MYRKIGKPLVDYLVAGIAIIVAFPVMVVLTFALLIIQKTNPFFVQPRVGKHNRVFKLVKFKTMNEKKDAQGKLLPDAHRLTAIGKFVRSTSLDELPQLLNVLKGDMSLIGPRPLLVKYLPLYNERQIRRHEVKPGITGWAQINGRNAISWQDRFELDVFYVENVSLALDCRIVLLTIKKVLKREDINAQGTASMEAFKGN